jgi:hypothetical protein
MFTINPENWLMDLLTLLASRDRLLEQARLANTAYAYVTIKRCSALARRARLSGLVRLQQPDPEEDRYWAELSSVFGNQSVLEEHFSEDDVTELADAVAFATGETPLDVTFEIGELEQRYAETLAQELQKSGVNVQSVRQAFGATESASSASEAVDRE